MRIDAHQHFWRYDPVTYGWITEEMKAIRRDFMPADLVPLLEHHRVDGTVLVQADQSENENDFMLDLALQYPFILGVVGWVDVLADDLESRLERWSSGKLLKGFRYVTQGLPGGFLTDPRFIRGVSLLNKFSFTYDLLIYENQLEESMQLVDKLPEMKLVVDHIAKPEIRNRSFDQWKKGMQQLAVFDHLSVKLSGLITEAEWEQWSPDQLEPYMDSVLELFGPSRILFGSDWPVCLLAGEYGQVINLVEEYVARLSVDEQRAIMGVNAIDFYQLNDGTGIER